MRYTPTNVVQYSIFISLFYMNCYTSFFVFLFTRFSFLWASTLCWCILFGWITQSIWVMSFGFQISFQRLVWTFRFKKPFFPLYSNDIEMDCTFLYNQEFLGFTFQQCSVISFLYNLRPFWNYRTALLFWRDSSFTVRYCDYDISPCKLPSFFGLHFKNNWSFSQLVHWSIPHSKFCLAVHFAHMVSMIKKTFTSMFLPIIGVLCFKQQLRYTWLIYFWFALSKISLAKCF